MNEDEVMELGDAPDPISEDTPQSESRQRISIGLSPLGGIAISVTDRDGGTANITVPVEEVWQIVGHLNAITGFLIGSMYANQIAEQEALRNKLFLPGRR